MSDSEATATDHESRISGSDFDDPIDDSPSTAFSQLLRGASGTAVLLAISNGTAFVTALLLARFLGRDSYGLYAFSVAWAGVLMLVSTLGVDRFLVRGVAIYEVEAKWELMKGLLQRTNQAVLLASISIAGAGCIVAFAWLSPALRGPFCLAMVLVPLTALTLLRQGAMQAFGRVVSGQLPEYLIRPLLILGGVGALQLMGGGLLTPTSAMAANVTGVAIAFVVGAILLLRTLPDNLNSVRPEYATREWMRASIPMMLITGVWTLNYYVGTLVTGTLRGPGAAGVYNVVQNGAALIILFSMAANMPLAPAVAQAHARGDRKQLESITERIAWVGLLVSIPICVAFMAFPGFFLGLFGDGFQIGSTALRVVVVGQLVNTAAGPSGIVLIMTGHELGAARAVAVGAFANLVFAIVLVPPLGVTGSAIAFSSSLVIWNVALVVMARRRLGVNVTAFRRLSVARHTADQD